MGKLCRQDTATCAAAVRMISAVGEDAATTIFVGWSVQRSVR